MMPSRCRHLIHACSTILFTLVCLIAVAAQQRPLLTEDVDIIPPGSARFEVGVDFFQNAKFPFSGLTGDLTRVGVVGVNIGLSPNVEVQLEGVIQNFLSINSAAPNPPVMRGFAPGANSTNDTGDFRLSTKNQAAERDAARALARLSVRRRTAELRRVARARDQSDQRFRSRPRGQKIRAR